MVSVMQRMSKLKTRPLAILIGVLLFAAVMTYVVASSFAASGSATIYTIPEKNQSVAVGATFPVAVRIATPSGVPVTGSVVYMTYPTDKFQIVSVDYEKSSYNLQLLETNNSGVLRMERAALPMIAGGDQLFAIVNFKAIKPGKNASINFTTLSKTISGEDDSNILTAYKGVNYNIANTKGKGR